jgi:hypothetical protein
MRPCDSPNAISRLPPHNFNPSLLSFLVTADYFFWSSRDLFTAHRRATGSPTLFPPCPVLNLSYADVFSLLRSFLFALPFFWRKKWSAISLHSKVQPFSFRPIHGISCALAIPPFPFSSLSGDFGTSSVIFPFLSDLILCLFVEKSKGN